MASYATKVKRDIARWVETGLIDAATGGRLSADIERSAGGSISLGAVLAMMAASLFAAAILIFIAANWDEMPRLLRLAMLFSAIAGGYVGGAVLKLRGQEGFAEAAWIAGAAAFGASIALVAQMYHMSGDEKQAVFVWGAGTALAAAALRSGPLTAGAVLLAVTWLLMSFDFVWAPGSVPLFYLAIAAVLYGLSFWTHGVVARHLILLSLGLFAALHHGATGLMVAPLLLVAGSIALAAFAHAWPAEAESVLGLGPALSVHALIGFLTGVGIMQIELVDERGFGLLSAAAFAGLVAMLLLKGRQNAVLRWIAYAAFIFQLCFVYVVMLGSMLGTAGFFVVGGLALSLLAWLIARLERRFSGPAVAGGVS